MTPERLSEIIAATDGSIRPPEGEPAPRKPTLAEVHAMAASLARIAAILEPLLALEAAASFDGKPWKVHKSWADEYVVGVPTGQSGNRWGSYYCAAECDSRSMARFIAAARNALPALLRAIQETP